MATQRTLREYQTPVLQVNKSDLNREVLEEALPVSLTFTSSTCMSCAKMLNTLNTLSKVYSGRLKFLTIDTSKAGDFFLQYRTKGTPLTLLFYKGKVIKAKNIVNHDSNHANEAIWLGSAENIQYFITFLDSALHAVKTNIVE
jgi:thioredoxin-like negative regulator of GroEL